MENKHRKLTLEDLLRAKEIRSKDKLKVKEFYLPNLDGYILFESKRVEDVIDLMDSVGNMDSNKDSFEFSKELIYNHCPIMHNKEMQEKYECIEPFDIVTILFDNSVREINKAADVILGFYDLNDTYENLKN